MGEDLIGSSRNGREREREREFWHVGFWLERERESETDLHTNRSRRCCRRQRKEMELLHLGRRSSLTGMARSIFFTGESGLNSPLLKSMIYPFLWGRSDGGNPLLHKFSKSSGRKKWGEEKSPNLGFPRFKENQRGFVFDDVYQTCP